MGKTIEFHASAELTLTVEVPPHHKTAKARGSWQYHRTRYRATELFKRKEGYFQTLGEGEAIDADAMEAYVKPHQCPESDFTAEREASEFPHMIGSKYVKAVNGEPFDDTRAEYGVWVTAVGLAVLNGNPESLEGPPDEEAERDTGGD